MGNNIRESNLERFQNLVYSDDLDIVCVNETWLSGHVYNAEILHSGYSIVRIDRKTRGGGVLLGIKTAVFTSVREIEHNHDLEIAMTEITTAKNMKLLICSCYRPPDHRVETYRDVTDRCKHCGGLRFHVPTFFQATGREMINCACSASLKLVVIRSSSNQMHASSNLPSVRTKKVGTLVTSLYVSTL